ncbi:amino acid adenylation domain-containing protein [Micromonospora sp. CA-246542]|uniref:amino acid adenylation domain-containing protein n=1 Tax=Micromonospora sp. CA-246542 TaxID=3239959 RepID=UPI003D8D863A
MISPATPGQLRFYLLDQQEGGSARTLVKHLTITGTVDQDRLVRAIRSVLAAQPALRTSLVLGPEGLAQRIDAPEAVAIELDATVPVADRVRQVAEMSFKHGAGPLSRWWVYRSDRRTDVVLAVHHAVFDEDSSAILVDALSAAYASDAGLTGAVVPAPVADNQLVEFWRGYFAGFGEPTRLPQISAADPGDRRRGEYEVVVPAELAVAMRRAAQAGATPFAQTLAALTLTLGWYRSDPDVVVAVVAGGRRSGEDRTIGCLQNTVPVRVRTAATTDAQLDNAIESLYDALEHAALPVEQIISLVPVAREPGRKPLTDVICTESRPSTPVVAAGLQWQLAEITPTTVEYDLGVTLCHDGTGGFRLAVEYRIAALGDAVARRFAHHLLRALAALAGDPADCHQVRLLDDDETAGSPVDDVRPATATVAVMILDRCRRDPDAVAVVSHEGSMTYGALDHASGVIAASLRQAGVGPGDRVGVQLSRDLSLLPALLGIWRVGAGYVPLDPDYPAARLAMIVEDAELSLVIGVDDLPPAVAPEAEPVGTPEDVAYIIHTSGSTGRPKGVVIRHRNLVEFFAACDQVFGPLPAAVVSGTSLSFDISVLELFWPLSRGSTVHLTSHRTVSSAQVPPGALFQCTPTVARLLASSPDGQALLKRVGTLLVGGEPLPADLAAELVELTGGQVYNCYGPTETTIWSTWWRVTPGQSVSIGTPFPGERCWVVNASDQLVPTGSPGRLMIAGHGVGAGYWRRDDLTAQRFRPLHAAGESLVYDTGDIVVRTEEGLRFEGRADAQVKILGQRIELGEIEAVIRTDGRVAQVAVTPGADRTSLVAFVVPAAAADPQPTPLETTLARHLHDHAATQLTATMVPTVWFAVAALPQLPNGKLDRARIVDWGRSCAAPVRPAATLTVADGMASLIHQVWADVLGVAPASPDQTFFELGGTSSGVLRVLVVLRERFPQLTAGDLFRHTTVRALAAFLDRPVATPDRADARGTHRARTLAGWQRPRRMREETQ